MCLLATCNISSLSSSLSLSLSLFLRRKKALTYGRLGCYFDSGKKNHFLNCTLTPVPIDEERDDEMSCDQGESTTNHNNNNYTHYDCQCMQTLMKRYKQELVCRWRTTVKQLRMRKKRRRKKRC